MAEELTTQNTEVTQPTGADAPVTEPVTEPTAEPGAAEVTTTTTPPDTVPYSRFKEKNEEAKLLKELLLQSRQAAPATAQPEPVQAPPIPGPQLPARPDPTQFTDADGYRDNDKYLEAVAEWKATALFLEREHQGQIAQQQQQVQASRDKAQSFVSRVTEQFPDFLQNLAVSGNPTDAVAGAIFAVEGENPQLAAQIAYHLAKNPAEMHRLNNMNPYHASVMVGQLAAKLSAPGVQPKLVSNAPAPAGPVKSTETSTGVVDLYDPHTDTKDYAAHHPAAKPWV